jgi:glyoxylase-like metal-dependent hydrolase (beta-lactamase superfamily II)
MLEDEFGDLIAKARGGLGISAQDLSQRSGVSQEDIAAFEGYRKNPAREQSDALARVLELDLPKLWEIAAESWEPAAVTGMISGTFPVENVWYERYRVWTYVVGDPESNVCLIVDPGGDANDTLAAVESRGWKICAVLATHTHGDHVGVLASVVGDSEIPVFVGAGEASSISAKARKVIGVEHRETFSAGPWTVEARLTPGHTAASTCFLIDDGIFVGDAMFAGSLGRTNLAAGAYREHIESVRREVLSLPAATAIFPGHGAQSTVGEELANNPFF